MEKLRYIEFNGQPVISARDLYSFLTFGSGEHVFGWISFCNDHPCFTKEDDMFEIITEAGHRDYLLSLPAALVLCGTFRNDRGKAAFVKLRDLIAYEVSDGDIKNDDDTVITINHAAKILQEGPNELLKTLREAKVLSRANVPLQHYVNAGYFKVISADHINFQGKRLYYAKAMVTTKGLKYLTDLVYRNKLLQEGAA